MAAFDINEMDPLVGWNQVVTIDFTDLDGAYPLTAPSGTKVLRVESYNIGVRQTSDAPDYVTGRQDRTAFKRGPIVSEGDIRYPFTLGEDGVSGTGLDLFLVASELAKNPKDTFSVTSSAHPSIGGCKINTSALECQAEAEISANSNIWGIVDDESIETVHSYGNYDRVDSEDLGEPNGVDVVGQLLLEQIPMFDACSIVGAPVGMFIVGFTINIDNQLKRLYTMGTGESGDTQYSPFGLNATAIAAMQRRVTGTITWQSNASGTIKQIIGSGISALEITIAGFKLTLNKALWMAEPPTLSAADRVTVQSSFIAMGTGDAEFDALVIDTV